MPRVPRRRCDECHEVYRPRATDSRLCRKCRDGRPQKIDPFTLHPSNELKGIDPSSIKQGSLLAGVRWSGDTATVTSPPTTETPKNGVTPEDILRIWDLDPDEWEIVGDVKFNTWNGYKRISKDEVEIVPLYQYTIRARERQKTALDDRELDRLTDYARFAPPKARRRESVGETFVIDISDIQMGKADGDGARGTIARLENLIPDVLARVDTLRAAGRSIGECLVIFGGDLIEHVNGHYAMQGFTTDLNLTQQQRVVRRWAVRFFKAIAPLFSDILVVAVPGNHGEAFREEGKSATDFEDNFDVEVIRSVAEVLDEVPAYSHISFMFPPKNELVVVTEIQGHLICVLHGHQAKGSGNVQKRMEDWLLKHAGGLGIGARAEFFFTHHYHFPFIHPVGIRYIFGGGALDGGSIWFNNTNGETSAPCAVTLVIDEDGWGDYHPLWARPVPPEAIKKFVQLTGDTRLLDQIPEGSVA